METELRKVAVGYARLFPELLDRFHQNDDQTIVDLIAEKAIDKIESKIVDLNNLKIKVKEVLKNL